MLCVESKIKIELVNKARVRVVVCMTAMYEHMLVCGEVIAQGCVHFWIRKSNAYDVKICSRIYQ